ncbi:hypothetical protein NA57DRAFT_35731 [Rhizodiscina lignyota]|uniref:Pro-apoptotic serine protease NMA111 n=1 Tax=Rhizodiscina lignyota TaxID=1504668 RepID=A0A9P4IPR1_9PEZI|nr:hypothetical protein NA57DRAFT_35731 [Rhizodiscina lignyota]
MEIKWQDTIEEVKKHVVRLRYYLPFSWDGEEVHTAAGTGFLVEGGYILTNKHIVGSGGFRGRCTFWDKKEADVFPIYRDPEHDFGILRVCPKFAESHDLTGLQLKPEEARVGVEICVIGNDYDSELSISKGVISRLDKNSNSSYPNTNMIQAAAGAKSGSSGSPVVTLDGHVVGLMASGYLLANINYFVPLDRIAHILHTILTGNVVRRGTLQTQWLIKSFEECRRLGLESSSKKAIQSAFPDEVSMLIAEKVLKDGPASGHLEAGDILLRINGKPIVQFSALNELMDNHIGDELDILFSRNGKEMSCSIKVQDFADISPTRVFCFGGWSFHELPYIKALEYGVPVKGVLFSGGCGTVKLSSGDPLILSVDDEETPDLDTFIRVIRSKRADQHRAQVKYRSLTNLHLEKTEIAMIDRQWKAMSIGERNDNTGLWQFEKISDFLPAEPQSRSVATMAIRKNPSIPEAITRLQAGLVQVETYIPTCFSDNDEGWKDGFGMVVDDKKGYVLVSRDTVPHNRCHVTLIVGASLKINATVRYIHPLLNCILLQYDAALVDGSVRAIKFSGAPVTQGEKAYFLRMEKGAKSYIEETVVVLTETTQASFRSMNIDIVEVNTNVTKNGLLASADGSVKANWIIYPESNDGLMTVQLLPILDRIRMGDFSNLQVIDVQFETLELAKAADLGVSRDWIARVGAEDPDHPHLFQVSKVNAGYTGPLEDGDILLTLNGNIVTRAVQLDVQFFGPSHDARIVRKGKELTQKVSTSRTDDIETSQILYTCGLYVHRPPYSKRQTGSEIFSEVYISYWNLGSPAALYGLNKLVSVTKVNGESTLTLEAFCNALMKIEDGVFFKIEGFSKGKEPKIATIQKDELYHPTIMMFKDSTSPTGWGALTLPEYMEKYGSGQAELEIRPSPDSTM